MREFTKEDGLPEDLLRWKPTVEAMLLDIPIDGPLYLMVDQSFVHAGAAQRRPGLHVDGYWIPRLQCHGRPEPGHGHCVKAEDWPVEAILLASNVSASRSFVGEYDGVPGEGGDCSHIGTENLNQIRLLSDVCWAGNVTMLHESLPVAEDCFRTLVRINVPGWSP